MVQNMSERKLADIHLKEILKNDSRKDELISIIEHYFSSKPSAKAKWEKRYSKNTEVKNKPKGRKEKNDKTEGTFEVASNNIADNFTE